ncbi:MAG: hypothetical protein CMJ18_27700 [Phycisphaeraceae bacterium]|nr:hypothetical protein [Phycisphaeraceae bacterium]
MWDGLNTLDPGDWLTIGATFGLVLAIWLACVTYYCIRRAMRVQRVQRRLGLDGFKATDADGRTLRLWHAGQESTTTVPRGARTRPLIDALDRWVRDAGWEVPLSGLLMAVTGMAMLAAVTLWLITRSLVPTLAAAAAIVMLFWLYTKKKKDRRVLKFDTQFAEALGLVSRSLRAGHPLLAGFQVVADQMPAPVGDLFRQIVQQHDLGIDLEEALSNAGRKSSSTDLQLFATSVTLQLRSGGNLADLMDRLAEVIRDRMRLGRKVRVLTAQTQFSKRVLIVLPFIVFAVLNLINADYMQPLYTTGIGRVLLLIAGASLLLGTWVMSRVAVLKY